MNGQLGRRLDDVHLIGLYLDGIVVARQSVVVALGLAEDGSKVPHGLWHRSTENSTVCTALLDPFVRLHRVNENQAGDVSAVLGYLRDLQCAHDLALVVVHHARKNGGPTGRQSRLAIVAVEPRGNGGHPVASTDVDNAILSARDRAAQEGLERHALRLIVRVQQSEPQ